MKKYSHNYGEHELNKQKPVLYSKIQEELKKASKKEDGEIKEAIEDLFSEWKSNKTVNDNLSLRYDFRKEGIQVEFQFGNVARYYADIMKLEYSVSESSMDYGILIVPTKKRAERMGHNLAYYERAKNEMQEFRKIIESSIVIFGV